MISPSRLLIKHRVCMSRVAPATVPWSCFVDPRWMCRLCRSSHVPDSWNWSSLAHSGQRWLPTGPGSRSKQDHLQDTQAEHEFQVPFLPVCIRIDAPGHQQWPGVYQEMEVPETGLPPSALPTAWSPLRPFLSFGATHIWSKPHQAAVVCF